jgi:hypothetical protein
MAPRNPPTPTDPTLTTPELLAYQWPPLLDEPEPLPLWLEHALNTQDLRISDDLGHIKTPEGELTIKPGDWVVKSRNGLYAVWSDDLYHAFVADEAAHSTKAALLVDDDPDFNSPDTGAETGDPHNALVEGADTPDEPDTKSAA